MRCVSTRITKDEFYQQASDIVKLAENAINKIPELRNAINEFNKQLPPEETHLFATTTYYMDSQNTSILKTLAASLLYIIHPALFHLHYIDAIMEIQTHDTSHVVITTKTPDLRKAATVTVPIEEAANKVADMVWDTFGENVRDYILAGILRNIRTFATHIGKITKNELNIHIAPNSFIEMFWGSLAMLTEIVIKGVKPECAQWPNISSKVNKSFTKTIYTIDTVPLRIVRQSNKATVYFETPKHALTIGNIIRSIRTSLENIEQLLGR